MTKWKLEDGLAELKREQEYRGRSFPTLVGRGVMSEQEANQYNAALDGTLTFLEFCKRFEVELREFMRGRLDGA